MSERDRQRWDERYTGQAEAAAQAGGQSVGPPALFVAYQDLFPTHGRALDVACGLGTATVWLACRGLDAWGVDVSPVAIARARQLAARHGVDSRCRFDVVDLDGGLPDGPPEDVVLCHLFRDARLDGPMARRLAAGGLLAIAALTPAGGHRGPYRSSLGDLLSAFASLKIIASGEAEGRAWLLGRK